MSIDIADLNSRLWSAADQLRANSRLRSSEYGPPVLGLIFLRYADQRFRIAHAELSGRAKSSGGRRTVGKADYQAKGVLYLPEPARYEALLSLPEGANLGRAINDAMKLIEQENPELKDVLPKSYPGLGMEDVGVDVQGGLILTSRSRLANGVFCEAAIEQAGVTDVEQACETTSTLRMDGLAVMLSIDTANLISSFGKLFGFM